MTELIIAKMLQHYTPPKFLFVNLPNRNNMIDDKRFLKIIDSTPLVSIDLILEDQQGQILLGKRANRPAQGYWFVPGGRIRKNETIADAIKRISSTEIGTIVLKCDAKLLGAFDHIYNDNYLGEDGIKTHYVVLAYKVTLNEQDKSGITSDAQHSEIKWWSIVNLVNDPDVHQNTRAYFTDNKQDNEAL